jgi:PhoH-like ATPase
LSDNYTGFKTVEVDGKKIDDLFAAGSVPIWDKRVAWYQNMYMTLVDEINPQHTGVARVCGEDLVKLSPRLQAAGVKSRNCEQLFALDALLDPTIELVVLTGGFGTGKTLLAIAGAIAGYEQKNYSQIILSKPMTQIGKHKIGTLPGEIADKFHPYLVNYESNFKQICGKHMGLQDVLEHYNIEFRPIQLFLGASFVDTFLIVDEAQNLENLEVGALLTRAGEGSKICIMGDYKQVHDQIDMKAQGIKKLVNDLRIKNSPLVAVIELQRCERSPLASLIGEVFGE